MSIGVKVLKTAISLYLSLPSIPYVNTGQPTEIPNGYSHDLDVVDKKGQRQQNPWLKPQCKGPYDA
jgi:hypothetical protein